jgi:hypothetical protein
MVSLRGRCLLIGSDKRCLRNGRVIKRGFYMWLKQVPDRPDVEHHEEYGTHEPWRLRVRRGKLQRNRERITVRGLNDNHNKDLKNLFKGAAISASTRPGPLQDFYVALVGKGIRPTMARLTLARKIAAITLTMWKKGVSFDPKQLPRQAA